MENNAGNPISIVASTSKLFNPSPCMNVPKTRRYSGGKRRMANKFWWSCATRSSGTSCSSRCTGDRVHFGILCSNPAHPKAISQMSALMSSSSWAFLATNPRSSAHTSNQNLYSCSWMTTPYPTCSHRGSVSLYTLSQIHRNNVGYTESHWPRPMRGRTGCVVIRRAGSLALANSLHGHTC